MPLIWKVVEYKRQRVELFNKLHLHFVISNHIARKGHRFSTLDAFAGRQYLIFEVM